MADTTFSDGLSASGSTEYASYQDFTDRFDERTLEDLSTDTGNVPDDAGNERSICAALLTGSGRVDAAVLVGKIYSVADLDALTGNSLALLKDITCMIAMSIMLRRRPGAYDAEFVKMMMEDAEKYLDQLRKGERLFNVDDVVGAGNPTIDGPSSTDYNRLNLIPDRTNNFYPNRKSRLPLGR